MAVDLKHLNEDALKAQCTSCGKKRRGGLYEGGAKFVLNADSAYDLERLVEQTLSLVSLMELEASQALLTVECIMPSEVSGSYAPVAIEDYRIRMDQRHALAASVGDQLRTLLYEVAEARAAYFTRQLASPKKEAPDGR